MTRISFGCVIALCLLLGTPPMARADNASEAALQFELGQELYRQRRYAEALERFVASNRLVPNAGVMFNIAQTYQLLRRPREAYNWYETYLHQQRLSDEDRIAGVEARDRLLPRVAVVDVRTNPEGATLFVGRRDLGAVGVSPRRIAIDPGEQTLLTEMEGHHPQEQRVEAVRGQVVETSMVLRPVTGSLAVTSHPSGATVRIDEVAAGTTPLSVVLPVGMHRVEVHHRGFVTSTREASIEADGARELDVALERSASEVAVLTVSGGPAGARVLLDGDEVGQLPLTLGGMEPGARRIRIESPDHGAWEAEVALEPGGATRVHAQLVRSDAGAATWRYGTYGAGAAMLLAGAIAGGLSLAARSAFFDADNPSRADLDRARAASRAADVLLVLGALTVGFTLTFDLVRSRPTSRGRVEIDR